MSKNYTSEFSFAERTYAMQERTYAVYGETFTVKVTITINGDIDYINITYIQNDSEVQPSRKPVRIRSYSLKWQNNEKRVYSVVVCKRTKFENVMDYKFDYKDIDYGHNVIYINIPDGTHFDVAMATCSIPVSYLFKMKYNHLRLNKAKYLVLSKTYASPTFIGSLL